MAAEGADLLCAQSARTADSELACVLPFPYYEYQKDFSSIAAANVARSIIENANSRFILPGTREEGPRSYERANNVILANIDLLIALWDGERAAGRGGTGDVVQSAIMRRIPIIVITPKNPNALRLLVAPTEDELENPIALDLKQKPLDADLTLLVSQILSPPQGPSKRQGLVNLFGEKANYWGMRYEYPMLLKLFGVATIKKAMIAAHSNPVDLISPSTGHTDDISVKPSVPITELQRGIDDVDNLANHYAQLYRSSTTSEYLLIILAGLFSGLAQVFFSFVAGASIVGQVAVNGLVLIDAIIRKKMRWEERWLDYRTIAERLKCVRFLHSLGSQLGSNLSAVPAQQ